MPHNLRPLPQYPWQSQVPASPTSEQPIGLHRNRDTPAPGFSGEHLDIDINSEKSFASVPQFRVLHLDEMDSVHHVARSRAFSGSPDGPSVSHLRQDYNALITNMKLKLGVVRLNKNDYFHLLVSLTTGGARDQATALERELVADLAERNAAARRKYERDQAEYDRQMLLWDARTPPKKSFSKDKEAEPPKPPVEPEKLTEYADPIGKLWKLFEKLYPERSKSRTDEFTQFQLRPNETIASLVQRMQTLKLVFKQSEQAAATRLLAALRLKKLQEEVRRMMIFATDGLDEWTVSQLDEFAIRLDRIASKEALWNSTIQADTSTSRGAPPTTRGGETRVCHNCGKPGHIAPDCRSKPRAGNAAINMRPANALTNQHPGPRGPCYHCHQMGHVAAKCPDRQPGGKLARREPGKPWCEHHRVNSHSTAECRALNNDKPKAEAKATNTVDEGPASSHDAPDCPTYNELLEFWESNRP
jgi:hypothetical protein